jgi:hypothetical protein
MLLAMVPPPEAFANCHSFQVSSKPIDYVPPASAADAKSLPKEEFEGHRCDNARIQRLGSITSVFAVIITAAVTTIIVTTAIIRQQHSTLSPSSSPRRSCQLSAWRSGVDTALSERLTPLLLCPDTVYDELKALISLDPLARILDVRPLSPSGLRTKVPPPHPEFKPKLKTPATFGALNPRS